MRMADIQDALRRMKAGDIRLLELANGTTPVAAQYGGHLLGILAAVRKVSRNRWRLYHLGPLHKTGSRAAAVAERMVYYGALRLLEE